MPNNSIILPNPGLAELLVDPYFANVVFLMDMKSTTLVDIKGHPLTATGPAVIDAGVPGPFSPYSLTTNGTGYVSTPDSNDWDVSDKDFTYEVWAYPTTSVSPQYLFNQAGWGDGNSSVDFLLYGLTPGANSHTASSNFGTITASANAPLNQWTHIAYERFGNRFTIYVGGKGSGSTNDGAGNVILNAAKPLVVGASGNGIQVFQGRLGGARLTKGLARYKEDFVPMNFPAQ